MGAGASIPDEVTREQAMELAGERWNDAMASKFDSCKGSGGTVPRKLIEEHSETKSLAITSWADICASASPLTSVKLKEPPAPLEGLNPPEAGVVKMQGLARAQQAKVEVRRKTASKINNSLEMAQERKENKLDLLMSNLHDAMPKLEEKTAAHDALLDTIDKMRKAGWPQNLEVEEGYKGLELPAEVTKDAMIDLLEKLNNGARKASAKRQVPTGVKGILHAKYALQIAVSYMDVVRKLSPVIHVSTALSGKITVVGDMHGQLRDLCEIFRNNGFPSFDNPYLFNGDLVDRGEYSAEICLLLMGFAVADPGSVFINRGNHEDMTVCTGYGFVDELVTKFSQNVNGRHLLAVIDTIFSLLPLAHVIDENVVVIHGGISDRFTLDTLKEINRRPYRTLTGLPATITQKPDGKDADGHSHEVWAIMMDCLWSDPAKNGERFPAGKECKPNDERGGGVIFSAKHSKKWLDDHKLGVLVRSHECMDHGFLGCHDMKVLTLFSASNYYGDDEANDGAILILSPLMPNSGRLLTYATAYSGKEGYHKMNLSQSVAKLENSALQRVNVALLDYRRELVEGLQAKDPDGTGVCKTTEWAEVMNTVLPIKLPWLHLKVKFVDAAGPDTVNYTRMTDQLQAAFNGSDQTETLYRMRGELQKLFRILDADGSGVLDRQEFITGCELINKTSGNSIFSKEDVDDFMKRLDKNGDGQISFQEFTDGLLAPVAQKGDEAKE